MTENRIIALKRKAGSGFVLKGRDRTEVHVVVKKLVSSGATVVIMAPPHVNVRRDELKPHGLPEGRRERLLHARRLLVDAHELVKSSALLTREAEGLLDDEEVDGEWIEWEKCPGSVLRQIALECGGSEFSFSEVISTIDQEACSDA